MIYDKFKIYSISYIAVAKETAAAAAAALRVTHAHVHNMAGRNILHI